jgi:zinc protease
MRTVEDLRTSLIDRLYNDMAQRRIDLLMETEEKPFNRIAHSLVRNAFNQSPQIDALYTYLRLTASQPIEPAIKAAIAEINRIALDGFLQQEFLEAIERVRLENSYNLQGKRTSKSIATGIANFFGGGSTAMSPEFEDVLSNNILRELTLEEVNRRAASWINDFTSTNIVITRSEVSEIMLPTERTVFKWIESGRKIQLSPYHQPNRLERLMTESQIPKTNGLSIVSRDTTYENLDIRELEFVNGLKVLIKRRPADGHQADRILLEGYRAGGALRYPKADYRNAMYAGMVSQNGIDGFDKSALDRFLRERGLWSSFEIHDTFTKIVASSRVEDIETLLQLLRLQLTAPRRNKSMSNILSGKDLTAKKDRMPGVNAFYDSLVRLTSSVTSTVQMMKAENVNKTDVDRIYDIFSREFSNPREFTFVITGTCDEQLLKDLVTKYFGTLQGDKLPSAQKQSETRQFIENRNRTFYMGDNQNADVHLYFPGHYKYSLKNQLLLEILQQTLEIRMTERLREKEGGTYHVNVGGEFVKQAEGSYNFSISFICPIENVEHMVEAALNEMRLLKEGGLDEIFLGQVKKRLQQKQVDDSKTWDYWSHYIMGQFISDRDFDDLLTAMGMLDFIQKESVNKAAKNYLNPDTMSRFVLLPASVKPDN